MRPCSPQLPALAVLTSLLGACSTIGEPPHDWLLLPTAAVVALDSGYLKIPALAAGVAVYALVDPLAPNWTLQEARLGDERYRLALRMKALHSGGDGEARQVFSRWAAQLASQPGFAGYDVTAWEEGIDSTRPFSRRVALGEIRLRRLPAPLASSPP